MGICWVRKTAWIYSLRNIQVWYILILDPLSPVCDWNQGHHMIDIPIFNNPDRQTDICMYRRALEFKCSEWFPTSFSAEHCGWCF